MIYFVTKCFNDGAGCNVLVVASSQWVCRRRGHGGLAVDGEQGNCFHSRHPKLKIATKLLTAPYHQQLLWQLSREGVCSARLKLTAPLLSP